MEFHNTLETWYLKNKRNLPWRTSLNPYFIWLSEIILQQTRVQQGLAYYEKFIKHYPTVQDLANASEDAILKDWQGLGYYSRARNLHYSAKYICNELNGVFPKNYNDLLKLKGVGDYTASAIASISYNEKAAVVDGNVYRVLARYFDIDLAINSTIGIKYFKNLAQELILNADPRNYNQALMDFGATLCKPQNPDCDRCPLQDSCLAKANNTIGERPIKEKKIKLKHRYFNFLVFNINGEFTLLERRVGKGIWENLYQFPLIESQKTVSESELKDLIPSTQYNSITIFNEAPVIHKLSHQHLHTTFWLIDSNEIEHENKINWKDIDTYAVPILIHSFIESYKRELFSVNLV
ncbi:A/G-specific adenine glycosylase [Flavobacteriaceae bacterium]|nr:A/G-specific adenine glycosylase [Flavobacteriaceae bacterium]